MAGFISVFVYNQPEKGLLEERQIYLRKKKTLFTQWFTRGIPNSQLSPVHPPFHIISPSAEFFSITRVIPSFTPHPNQRHERPYHSFSIDLGDFSRCFSVLTESPPFPHPDPSAARRPESAIERSAGWTASAGAPRAPMACCCFSSSGRASRRADTSQCARGAGERRRSPGVVSFFFVPPVLVCFLFRGIGDPPFFCFLRGQSETPQAKWGACRGSSCSRRTLRTLEERQTHLRNAGPLRNSLRKTFASHVTKVPPFERGDTLSTNKQKCDLFLRLRFGTTDGPVHDLSRLEYAQKRLVNQFVRCFWGTD